MALAYFPFPFHSPLSDIFICFPFRKQRNKDNCWVIRCTWVINLPHFVTPVIESLLRQTIVNRQSVRRFVGSSLGLRNDRGSFAVSQANAENQPSGQPTKRPMTHPCIALGSEMLSGRGEGQRDRGSRGGAYQKRDPFNVV